MSGDEGDDKPFPKTDPPSAERADPFIGQLLADRYRILSALGEGGMARVYLALHTGIKRQVAIKVLLPRFVINKKIVRRFLNEGRAAGTIGHPNVVESLDMGETPEGAPFLVLELLEGTTLQGEIDRLGTIPVGRATYIASQIAMAVGAGHAQKIIHRDLKPDNVFLVERGRPDHVKVLDFGISKFMAQNSVNENPEEHTMTKTRQGELLGTPDFMAPEQITDPRHVDGRVDIYSLGVILYVMLSGRFPIEKASLSRMLEAIIADAPPPLGELAPDVPKSLVAVIERAMEKSPLKRQATMAELEADLHPFVIEPDARRRNSAAPPKLEEASHIEVLKPGQEASSVRIMPPKRERAEGHADTLASPDSVQIPRSRRITEPDAAPASTSIPASAHSKAPGSTLDAMSTQPRAAAKPWWQTWVVAIPIALVGLIFVSRDMLKVPAGAPSTPAPPPVDSAVSAHAAETVEFSVESATPESSVTFRGKTRRLPYHDDIRKGVDPELVEITAPDHRGRQFWIVLDQPQHLSFDLPQGSGTVRAGEEDAAAATPEPAHAAGPVQKAPAQAASVAKPIVAASVDLPDAASAAVAPVVKPAPVKPAGKSDEPVHEGDNPY